MVIFAVFGDVDYGDDDDDGDDDVARLLHGCIGHDSISFCSGQFLT